MLAEQSAQQQKQKHKIDDEKSSDDEKQKTEKERPSSAKLEVKGSRERRSTLETKLECKLGRDQGQTIANGSRAMQGWRIHSSTVDIANGVKSGMSIKIVPEPRPA